MTDRQLNIELFDLIKGMTLRVRELEEKVGQILRVRKFDLNFVFF